MRITDIRDYLTIGEFARLRGVGINSLLYYERLGILLPAYIDEKTKCRYYAPEQLSSLDIILLCIQLDIPNPATCLITSGSAGLSSPAKVYYCTSF